MLTDLQDILKANRYYFEDELKNIPSSPSQTSTVMVVDMDRIKNQASKDFGIVQYPKSSDLLIFCPQKSELHIIEMKRTATQTAKEFCATYSASTAFREKNVHTIFLLLSLASQFNINKHFFGYFFDNNPRQLKIRTSVLCDLPDAEMPFVFLSKINQIGVTFFQIIAGEVEIINCNLFEKYFAPNQTMSPSSP